jgi:hypothetical protein
MSDLKLSAIGAACGGGLMVAISQLQDAASDGLTFTEWAVGILAGIAVGGATGRVGYLAMRWVGRRYFGDEEDE